MDFEAHRRMKRKLQIALLSACAWIGASSSDLFAQQITFSEPNEVDTVQVRSNVRRAVHPGNRTLGRNSTSVSSPAIRHRQNLQIQVEDAQPSDEVRFTSTVFDADANSPVPIPDPIAVQGNASVIRSGEVFDDGMEEMSQESFVASPQVFADDWASNSCDAYCGDGCTDFSCGVNPCFPIASFLSDPICLASHVANRMQVRVTSVHFWMNGLNIPALATNDISGTVTANNTLFGGSNLLGDTQAGLRTDLTYWIDTAEERALWLRLYDSGDHDLNGNFDSANTAVVARPFIQSPATPNTVVVASAAAGVEGSLDIALKSSIEGGDLLLRKRISEDELVRTDMLLGYQSVRYVESLFIDMDIRSGGVTSTEYFEARNQFNGGQIGLLRTAHDGCWYFDGFAKVGLGQMNRSVLIDNFGTAGLLANSLTNTGLVEQNTFVMTPEFGVNAGYLLTNNLHFTVGYSFLRLPKITRVQDALDPDLVVDIANPPTVQRPAFSFAETNLNVQMLDLGLQYRY